VRTSDFLLPPCKLLLHHCAFAGVKFLECLPCQLITYSFEGAPSTPLSSHGQHPSDGRRA
jgi:hypothetical protein